MTGKYILDGKEPVEVLDLIKWGRWMEEISRTISRTDVGDGVTVSTVFLGLDHNMTGDGPPVLFETMIFGGERNEECHRYSTFRKAVNGHARIVKSINPDKSIVTHIPPKLERRHRS